ncbi:MAG: type II secretion system F family protein [Pseudomonadota bacterium]
MTETDGGRNRQLYRYRAYDASGADVVGAVDATSRSEAMAQLAEKDLTPYSISLQAPRGRKWRVRKNLTNRDLARYLRQLATLLSANVTALEAFTTLSRGRADPRIAERNRKILGELRAGKRLSAAMEAHLGEMPDYVFRLAELGEATGGLGKALSDAADRMEFGEQIRSEVRTALTYPFFLLGVGAVIVSMMFLFVVPRFATMMGDDLSSAPAISQFVIGLGLGFRANWPLVLAGLVGATAGGIALLRRPEIRLAADRFMRQAPVAGDFLRASDLAAWCRTVGIAVENKAHLIDALKLGESGATSPSFRTELQRARSNVRAGRSLEEALAEADPDFDPMVLDLIRTGRSSGALGQMLLFSAGLFEKDAREKTRQLTALAEPAAIVSIALVVAAVVISIVLAMTSLYNVEY